MIETVTMISSVMCLLVSAAVLFILAYERGVSRGYRKRESEAEDKLKQAAEEEERKSRAMDDGFANIMQYSVRGHDGFGGGQ